MILQELLLMYAIAVLVASSLVGFLVILATTRSLRVSLLCLCTMVAVVCVFVGLMVGGFGLDVGMVESVVLMVAIGLMLDPLTHVAHAYTEARGSRPQRVHAALTSIGISVLAGTLSTAGSCSCLFFTTIVLFSRFGKLLCSLMLICLVYSHLFLAPLLFLFGPEDTRTRGREARPPSSAPRPKSLAPHLVTSTAEVEPACAAHLPQRARAARAEMSGRASLLRRGEVATTSSTCSARRLLHGARSSSRQLVESAAALGGSCSQHVLRSAGWLRMGRPEEFVDCEEAKQTGVEMTIS